MGENRLGDNYYLCSLLRKGLHIVIVASMAVLLLFGTTAKEFIHSFSGHEDTVHRYHAPGEYSIENEHHHCDFLHYSLPDFANDVTYPYIPILVKAIHTEYKTRDVQFVQRELIRTSLRGPPAFIV